MEFSLKDAIALKHTYVDQSHRFWTYFQLAGAAATGFAWKDPRPGNATLGWLIAGFAAFAFANRRLVVDAQRAAAAVSEAIDKYRRRHLHTIEAEFKDVINMRKLDPPERVRLGHVAMTGAVIVLIALRFF